MNTKSASKRMMCALGFITLGVVSVSAFAQSNEYRRGYDEGYRDGSQEQSRQGQQEGPRGRVHIMEAQYGIQSASCDARESVQQAAGWHREVSIRASNELCGDPAVGAQKQLRITYRCGAGPALRADAREGSNATLYCR